MELAQLIKWVDDTNIRLERPTEDAREYNEDIGYILEFQRYIYAVSEHFLKMDKSNKEAFTRRLFRRMDVFITMMRDAKTDYIEYKPLPEEWVAYPEDLKFAFAEKIPLPEEWVEYLADEIYSDDIITFRVVDALFVDLLKVYCEVINLCIDSDIDPARLTPEYYRDTISDLTKFLRGSHRRKEDNDDDGKFKRVYRIDRIVAVKLLLEKAGVTGIDRTRLASFVEAVTGGNPATAPKDTYAYRNYNTKDTAGGIELLRKIGIE